MGNFWLKFKVWAKIVLFAVVIIYLVLFITHNSEEKARLWFWFQSDDVPPPETSVLRLVFFSFVSGVLVTVLVRTIWRTLRQVREMRHRANINKIANQAEAGDAAAPAAEPGRHRRVILGAPPEGP